MKVFNNEFKNSAIIKIKINLLRPLTTIISVIVVCSAELWFLVCIFRFVLS